MIDRNEDGSPTPVAFFIDDPPCESCGRPCYERISCDDLMVCDDCFEESVALQYAEKVCSTLHDAIIRSHSIQEVRQAMKEHKASCSVCGLRVIARKPVNSVAAPVPPAKEAA